MVHDEPRHRPGYTYALKSKLDDDTGLARYKYTHRGEFEVNPRWQQDWGGAISLRNRIEYRWIEDEGRNNTRSRDRVEFTFPLKQHGAWVEFFTSAEVFYNYRANEYERTSARARGDQLEAQ